MKRPIKRSMIFVCAAAAVCAAMCAASCTFTPAPESAAGPVKIVSFNLRRFDDAKAANRKVAGFMASLLRDADIAALQEGLGVSEAAVREFAGLTGANRGFVLGPAQGRNAFYRENVIFVYNKDRVTLVATAVYPDETKTFERPPMAAYFKTAGFDFIVVNCHIKPDETTTQTTKEIASLPEAARHFTRLWQENDALIAGDLNADGAYYDEAHLAQVFPQTAWTIITGNDCDTTVSANNTFTYDRFIISKSANEDWTGTWGVTRFDTWNECRNITANPGVDISDHYPVWAEFSLVNDTD
ncbi:MAG: endonuclease [Spirochaetaceae bacterium]|jgi:endonuclease/exonuclease/phosphatase family metal-dependent hydrolase|nr:endonuclease [Spirochaetaceae bacterium]